MKKKEQMKIKKQVPRKVISNEPLDINGNPLDPKREYLGEKIKIPFVSEDCSLYKNNSTIILFGGARTTESEKKQKSKFEEFLNKGPISFDNEEEV